MQVHDQLDAMDAQQLREFAAGLIETLASKDHELTFKQLKIDQLTHEMAVLKRWKYCPAQRAVARRTGQPAG